ncbi:hypothetical protein KsCSTR_05560 [Candidatus Kuenenia stuttgartiensis]|uniref:Uncharacterized protein n=1 Tax=Kuenenia stuttgartiensis TaxID=174633 RepID=Q1Q024_KUEST|nr:hypothetical protein KsCSTR_05560 [Candidatus Kuenenia stuttgartiensis]CAJ72685.1 unknown protein [Candidatus Kuenenia stuttgartiensis]
MRFLAKYLIVKHEMLNTNPPPYLLQSGRMFPVGGSKGVDFGICFVFRIFYFLLCELR